MKLHHRLTRLEAKLPPLPSRDEDLDTTPARRSAVFRRFAELLGDAGKLISDAEAEPLIVAFEQLPAFCGPLWPWFKDLNDGRCRLPQLTPQAMHDVLWAWLSPKCDDYTCICRHCGMEYPHMKTELSEWKVLPGKVPLQGPPPWYDVPAFFKECPGCGASTCDMEWAHLLSGRRPWMTLDGCARRL